MSGSDMFQTDGQKPIYMDRDGLKGKKVLLAEDNAVNREMERDFLGDAGCLVDTAENGQVAVDMVAEKGADYYDLILMDVRMPVMSGNEAIRLIRAMEGAEKLPILAVSAYTLEEDCQETMEAGASAFISKPLMISSILMALGNSGC